MQTETHKSTGSNKGYLFSLIVGGNLKQDGNNCRRPREAKYVTQVTFKDVFLSMTFSKYVDRNVTENESSAFPHT